MCIFFYKYIYMYIYIYIYIYVYVCIHTSMCTYIYIYTYIYTYLCMATDVQSGPLLQGVFFCDADGAMTRGAFSKAMHIELVRSEGRDSY